ncbi:proton-coupled zinc antiporter SLC30A1 [Culicoides brevitarsis]|uniref:proton-coupled zinc antiporter SLC30A1 n=1 Tax=Culicoides brevitarsis TaxID=469753 RepID=UPI00307B22ED
MPMKDILYRLQPFQLYIILCLSIAFFLVQLFLSHISHALTLLVQAYHMLCNIICLVGCILTLKHNDDNGSSNNSSFRQQRSVSRDKNEFVEVNLAEQSSNTTERSLRNTFGWTRIDVLSMLIVCIFLASLCFSIFVEALQTLVHLDHAGDTMHYPVYVFLCGILGLILNAMCYAVIGGYTFHQSTFLSLTSAGDVILDAIITDDGGVKLGDKRKATAVKVPAKRQNLSETCRDVCSSIFVIICAILVYFCPVPANDVDMDIPKYIDPVIAILSCVTLLYFSYPFMKEAGLILLQTIPDTIDIDVFKADLLKNFTEIINVHDLHIWQLTGSKFVSTAHIIFEDYKIYCRVMDDVVNYFHDQGITIVTIQPEFLGNKAQITPGLCLMPCKDKMCHPKICCLPDTILAGLDSCANSPTHSEICSTTQVLRLSEISSAVISENDTVLSCISLNDVTSSSVMSSPSKSQMSENDDSSQSKRILIQQSEEETDESEKTNECCLKGECEAKGCQGEIMVKKTDDVPMREKL